MFLLRMMLNCFHQQPMVDIVEETFDVQVDYPVILHAVSFALLYGLTGTTFRTITKAILVKRRFDNRFKFFPYHHLGYTVAYRRYPQQTFCAVQLRDGYLFNRLRIVAAPRKTVPYRVKILPGIGSDHFNGNPINTRTSPVGFNFLKGTPYRFFLYRLSP